MPQSRGNDLNTRMHFHCSVFHESLWFKVLNGQGAGWRSLRYSRQRTHPDALNASGQPSQARQLHLPLLADLTPLIGPPIAQRLRS